jgi:single-strand DNA-binding protein
MMFDTLVTVVGNVLNTPEWRRLEESGVVVANFKIATTSRRYDRHSNRWVDGASLRVRVNCWRRLAENVGMCVNVGDPLIVTGRLYSREWESEDHVKRVSYELDAVAVGHDLARGRGRFTRQRAGLGTTAMEDSEADNRVGGERTVAVPELTDRPRKQVYDEELGGYVTTLELDDPHGFGRRGGDEEEQVDTAGFDESFAALVALDGGGGGGIDAGVGAEPGDDDGESTGDESGDDDGGGTETEVEPSRRRRRKATVPV